MSGQIDKAQIQSKNQTTANMAKTRSVTTSQGGG